MSINKLFIKAIRRFSRFPTDQSLESIETMLKNPKKRPNLRTCNHLPMRLACGWYSAGDIELVKLLIANGASFRFEEDWPLQIACTEGQIEITKLLISLGADVRSNGGKLLKWVVKNNDTEMAKLLIENGARPNALQGAALNTAIELGNLEMAKFLIENGANCRVLPTTVIGKLVKNGSHELAELLIKNGLSLKDASTALCEAFRNGDLKMAKLLFDNKVTLNDDELTRLYNSSYKYDVEMVELFCENGLDMSRFAYCLLESLSQKLPDIRQCSPDTILRLLKISKTVGHYTLAHICEYQPIEVVQIMLEIGIKQDQLYCGIDYALDEGRADIAELLLANGVRMKDIYVSSRLPRMAKNGFFDAINVVIKHHGTLDYISIINVCETMPNIAQILIDHGHPIVTADCNKLFRKVCSRGRVEAVTDFLRNDPTLVRYWKPKYPSKIQELFHLYGDEHSLNELTNRLSNRKLERFLKYKPNKPPKSARESVI